MKLKSIFYSLLIASLTSTAYAQVKIGSNPGTIGATSNLEVEATNGNKTSVNKSTGQVTIVDGTQGANKVFTSDANGGGSWQTLATQRIPEVVYIGRQTSDYYVSERINFDDLKDRVPLTVTGQSLPGYNASTKQYTIQSDGFYRISAGAKLVGTLPPATTTGLNYKTVGAVYLSPFNVLASYEDLNNQVGPVLSVFWEAYMTAGQVVDLYISNKSQAGPQNILVQNGFLTVTKLF